MNAITEIDETQVVKRPCTCGICVPSFDPNAELPLAADDDDDEEAAAPASEAAAKAFAA